MVDHHWLEDLVQEDFLLIVDFHLEILDSVLVDFHLEILDSVLVDFLLEILDSVLVDFHLATLDSVQVDYQEAHLGEVSPHLVVVCHPVDLVALVDFLREALQVSHSVEAMVVEITVLIKLSRVLKTGSKLR